MQNKYKYTKYKIQHAKYEIQIQIQPTGTRQPQTGVRAACAIPLWIQIQIQIQNTNTATGYSPTSDRGESSLHTSNGHKLDWVFSTGSVCPYSVNLFMFQGLKSWAMNSVHWTHTTPSRYCCLEYTRAVQPERIAYPSSPIRSMLATLDPEFPFLMWKSTFSPATWWQTHHQQMYILICNTSLFSLAKTQ